MAPKAEKKQQARFHVDHEFTEMSRTVQEFENLVLDAAIMYILNSGNIKAICTIYLVFEMIKTLKFEIQNEVQNFALVCWTLAE